MFRVFKRRSWKPNPAWPHGCEPQAVPADSCRTVARFNTREEARDFCTEHNDRLPADETRRRLAGMYEFTEE